MWQEATGLMTGQADTPVRPYNRFSPADAVNDDDYPVASRLEPALSVERGD
jgi:hypothetical protein